MTAPAAASGLLSRVTAGAPMKPPRMVVYGIHGIGKTTFGCGAPAPIVLRTEDGLADLPVPTLPMIKSFSEMMQALAALYVEEHPYQTLVVDSLDWFEPLVWQQVALDGGKSHIEEFGYGKGYTYAVEKWAAFLEGLRALQADRHMAVILLAHAEIKRFDAPDSEPYDRYQIKLHKRAADLVLEWAEVVGFAHYEVNVTTTDVGFNKKVSRGVGTGRRLLGVEERPAYTAKNRYRLPPVLDLTWDAFVAACAARRTPVESAPAPLSLAAS